VEPVTAGQAIQLQRIYVRLIKLRFPNLTVEEATVLAGELVLAAETELERV
jgi:hypothetical protein